MIKNKRLFYISLVVLCITVVLLLPFPNAYPLEETILLVMNIPTKFGNGIHVSGMLSLVLLIIAFVFLVKSLHKFKVRAVLIALLIVGFLPPALVGFYQSTFATGIYAISYDSEEGQCNFDMYGEDTLQGECELPLVNHSNQEVTFDVKFFDEFLFEDEPPMLSLMNRDGLPEITLQPKESKSVQVKTDIDVSNMENHIESGNAMNFNIIVSTDGKERTI